MAEVVREQTRYISAVLLPLGQPEIHHIPPTIMEALSLLLTVSEHLTTLDISGQIVLYKKARPSLSKAYWQNTFITASRAMTDYLLDIE